MKTRVCPLAWITVLAAVLLPLIAGCSWSVGGNKGNTASLAPTQQPTRGQELIDLQKAHEAGAISDQECARLKQRIMDE